MKVLILGYSNIVRKRVLNVLKEKKIKIFIASKSYKKKIPGIKKQFKSYEIALKKSKPNFVYISFPTTNSSSLVYTEDLSDCEDAYKYISFIS